MLSNLDKNGLILLFVGLLIRYLIGNRRFRRRNVAGLQVFSSYLMSQVIPLMEWLFNLLGWMLIVVGVVSMLIRL